MTTIPGEFYYGYTCARCTTFIPRLYDDEKGEGAPVGIVGPPFVSKVACPTCGHVARYAVSSIRRARA